MTTQNQTKKPPTHLIWQIIGEDKKSRWIRCGAAWKNKDGKGFLLVFDAYPVTGRTMLRELKDKPKE